MNSNMISMSSSLAEACLSHSVHRIRFSGGRLTAFLIGATASGMLPWWFGVVAAFAYIVIVAIVV